jgi:hypothetical protein
MIEEAGAAALEVNWYELSTDLHTSSATVEDELVAMASRREGTGHDSRGGETVAVFHGLRQRSPSSSTRRAPMVSCSSTGSINPTSTSGR